jgi:hypothetical protein
VTVAPRAGLPAPRPSAAASSRTPEADRVTWSWQVSTRVANGQQPISPQLHPRKLSGDDTDGTDGTDAHLPARRSDVPT